MSTPGCTAISNEASKECQIIMNYTNALNVHSSHIILSKLNPATWTFTISKFQVSLYARATKEMVALRNNDLSPQEIHFSITISKCRPNFELHDCLITKISLK